MASPKKSSQSGFLCSTWTLVILLTLTGISVASYHQYPEKVQAVLDVLPPQVCFKIDDCMYVSLFQKCTTALKV